MLKGSRSATPEEMVEYLRDNVYVNEDGCRIWAGTISHCGRPRLMWRGKIHLVRRLMIELEIGQPLRLDEVVFDMCGDRKCVNREHVKVGTKGQALANAAKRGAYPRGAMRSLTTALGRAKQAKLPITERDNVRSMQAAGMTNEQIGRQYGVSGDAVAKNLQAWNRALGGIGI